ncbi:MAG: thiamine-phosphate kinase [Rhodopirellula sp.]|nr:thiamine-phosphate kinase [Rhodopirellula sp.]
MLPERTSEFQLIESFRAAIGNSSHVLTGIGDDTAVVERPDGLVLLAADMLLEGVHFDLSAATPFQVGRKVLAVNLSDIAAMAGRPKYALVSLALSRSLQKETGSDFAGELFRGLHSLAAEFDTVIVGGDTNSWDGPVVINVAILGEVAEGNAVTRSAAQPGDWIFVTGRLGGSIAGHHFDFTPRVNEALALRESGSLHAMIDISDGLIADLYHILEESGVGAVINEVAIPISAAAAATNDERSPLEHALGDGEDFELLFTVSPEDGQRLVDDNPLTIPLSHIGEIVAGESCQLRDNSGKLITLPRLGWSHNVGGS